MNTKTGEILEKENLLNQDLSEETFREVNHATRKQLKRLKVGRNETCPCGSGLKFKKCCLNKKFPEEVQKLIELQKAIKELEKNN